MMVPEIQILQQTLFDKLDLIISEPKKDQEAEQYIGYNFNLNQLHIKFRKAKVTPKKIGQFVTLWRRNLETKETEPFHANDIFDFYVIFTEQENKQGLFFFSRKILIQHQILTTENKEGKRGFRVYPNWDAPENKQALKTKNWQKEFFINLSETNYFEKFKSIIDSAS